MREMHKLILMIGLECEFVGACPCTVSSSY